MAAGKDIVSREQMAPCYYVAYCNYIGVKPNFGVNVGAEISVEVGMNPETYRRTVKKFELIMKDLQDDEEYTNSEHLYEKILKAYDEFVDMKIDEVLALSKYAFTEEAKFIGEQKKENYLNSQKKYAKNKKVADHKIVFDLKDRFEGLKKMFPVDRAKKMAIVKTASVHNKNISVIETIWNNNFVDC